MIISCGKLTRIVHICAKICKKQPTFSRCFELMTQCLTTNEYDRFFCTFWHKCAQFLSIFHRNYHSLSAKLTKTLHFWIFSIFCSNRSNPINCAVCNIARQVEHYQCFGQRQKRPKRGTVLQFGCFSKISISKQSNQIEARILDCFYLKKMETYPKMQCFCQFCW